MAELKLAKLPDRTPVKLTIAVMPDLHRALGEYADLYREAYGIGEALGDLIPYMLWRFLESDRAFVKGRIKGQAKQ